MRINKAAISGISVRGLWNRRLVVNIPTSLESMAVNVPLTEIRQVAVLGADPADNEKRFTVAAQIGTKAVGAEEVVGRWVRLGVFETAIEAEQTIQSVAAAMAGSRWSNLWAMLGISIAAGFVFVVLGAYFVNSQQGGPLSVNMPITQTASVPTPPVPTIDMAGVESAEQPATPAAPEVAPAGEANPVGIQMTPANEAAMREYFGAAK